MRSERQRKASFESEVSRFRSQRSIEKSGYTKTRGENEEKKQGGKGEGCILITFLTLLLNTNFPGNKKKTFLLRFVIVYMLGLRPFLFRILMEVSVTIRKTAKATERPTSREKSA